MNIGKEMRRIRKDAGVKQKVVAREIGISTNALVALEHGKSTPKQGTIDRFCKFFEIPRALLVIRSIEKEDLAGALASSDAKDVMDIIDLAALRIQRSIDRYNGAEDEL